MAKKKVFVSFDFDNDKFLKESLIGQAMNPDSPFEVIDGSMKEAAPEYNWEKTAEDKIRKAEMVVIMLGQNTYRARGVLKEVQIARIHNKQIVQIIGYKDRSCPPIPNAGTTYPWEWDTLKRILR